MSTVTRVTRRQAAALWALLLTAQLVLVTLTRTVTGRLRNTQADGEIDPEAGFTLVEWTIMLVIVAAAAAAVATLIYNWITNKAKGVTNGGGTNQ